ncbi:MAG: LarC family nickel insertion protein, partial [Planctomycetota bacterium]
MRILYLQPFSGASGDMFLGALLDVGAPVERIVEGLSGLGLPGWRIEVRTERRGSFRATRAVVETEGPAGPGGHAHRHLSDILRVVERSPLPAAVKDSASRVFVRLAEAEARVHGVDREEVHFHEVGALDSIVDIVGSCLGLHLLGVGEVVSAPPALGTGFVETSHGRLPLPAPATLELLRGVPVEHRDSGFELTTPTGAALLSTLAARFGTMPPLAVRAVGYGAGSDRPGP